MDNKLRIDETLVRQLIATQFPQWADLSIKSVKFGGWDNRTFHLGEHMLVRMPSAERYAAKVKIEQQWLPLLAPHLSFKIPQPLAMGHPSQEYPWHWSVYRWIDGESANTMHIDDIHLQHIAIQLAQFLNELHNIDTTNGQLPGAHNFYRGGDLAVYDAETRQAIDRLQNSIDVNAVTAVWEIALSSRWDKKPVWVHGDVSAGNILIKNGQLAAVIDFGGMGIGDPACDLVIAWTFLYGASREAFRAALPLDEDTWARARGWALWKALITVASTTQTNALEISRCWRVINELLNETYLQVLT